jgi:hypothetical protein
MGVARIAGGADIKTNVGATRGFVLDHVSGSHLRFDTSPRPN